MNYTIHPVNKTQNSVTIKTKVKNNVCFFNCFGLEIDKCLSITHENINKLISKHKSKCRCIL
jgi:hypothetical protein